jgi:hypothetical protein
MCHQRIHLSLGGEAGGRSLGFISLSLIRWATAEGRGYPSDAIASGVIRLVLVTDGYGPLVELGIWSLSANGHFGAQRPNPKLRHRIPRK